ncbi:anthranilate phosphoribosyltransferase [Moraxella osloensis]|uniref:Anthranilate phosphoribosyltransferase n=1 Tax=Faucicola osloensis TaxID=34062 RepID=A0A2D2LU19_FAUOS|nr:anthranilate phosphoribosyltransferase [Moraxella osloensis]ATR78514.1 anthranilate phosphoribosyltransferase [Moraxella osloensis]
MTHTVTPYLGDITTAIENNQPLTPEQTQLLLTTALDRAINTIDLTYAEMRGVMLAIMQGQCPDAMMGALLTALRMKGESIEEITAAAQVMRELAIKVDLSDVPHVVDIVGTGGDGANLFNVSTAATMVAAVAGCHVAKHGNGGVSGKSGSSDLLQQAGINLALNTEQITQSIKTHGIGFLFAPNHHVAMKHAMPIRRTLKTRTVFNILGPLTNPAGVKNAMIGVFNPSLCEPLANVFKNLGAEHVLVVGSVDNLDEISLATYTHVAELKDGKVSVYDIEPEDVGIKSQTLQGLIIDSPSQSLALIREALANNPNKTPIAKKAADMIALNAGATIYVAGKADTIKQGVAMAQDIISSGKALQKMAALASFTQQFTSH